MASAREAALVICLLAAVATLQGVQAGCPHNCKDCNSKGVCAECEEGYGLRMFHNRAICKPCDDDNCKLCSKDFNHCDKCDNDYHFNRHGECVKNRPRCPNYCKNCNRKGVCTECDHDYHFNHHGDCVKNRPRCPRYCKDCVDNGSCTECMEGYGLREGYFRTTCQPCNDDNCKRCSKDYNHCDKCEDGYHLNLHDECMK